MAKARIHLDDLAGHHRRRAREDGALVIRTVVPDADGHVRPVDEVARDGMAVGAAGATTHVILVVQVIDAVLGVEDGSVGVVQGAR